LRKETQEIAENGCWNPAAVLNVCLPTCQRPAAKIFRQLYTVVHVTSRPRAGSRTAPPDRLANQVEVAEFAAVRSRTTRIVVCTADPTGNLVTGQNPASGKGVGEKMITLMEAAYRATPRMFD
jgi:putative intracellular protease/amidase